MELSTEIVKRILSKSDGKLKKNFVFSPLSINTQLSMLAFGLKPGPTLDKLLSILGFKTLSDLHASVTDHNRLIALFKASKNGKGEEEGPSLSSVNGVWVDKKYTINPSFLQLLQTIYNSESSVVDFQNKKIEAIHEINAWVEKATRGLIRNLLSYPDVSKKNGLIIANTLYFKGMWDEPFDPSNTSFENFYALNGDIVKVPYMRKAHEWYSYASSNEFKILRLPYKNYWERNNSTKGKFSMYILLPDLKDGLIKLLEQFTSNPDLLNLPFKFNQIVEIRDLRIPKFNIRHKFQVSKIMEHLGLTMDLKMDANIFDGLNDDVRMAELKTFHSSCVVVNEHGTEAAAVTYEANMTCCLKSPPPIDFIVNHPFIFMIREDTTGTLVFFGAVLNPLKK